MGKYTALNDRIKKAFQQGFRMIYSSLDVERLYDELQDALCNPNNQRNQKSGKTIAPDRFDVFVNNAVYNKTFRGDQQKLEKLQYALEQELANRAREVGLSIINPRMRIQIIASANLRPSEIKVLARVSEGDEIATQIKTPGFVLNVIKAEEKHQPWKLEPGNSYLIGRSADNCDIYISQKTVSRVHALIEVSISGELYLMDKGSTHKTYINQELEPIHGKVKLESGSYIRLGKLNPVVLKIEKQ